MVMGALDWNEDRGAAPLVSGPPNRATVVIVTCPTCTSRRVTRTNVVGPVGYWKCNADTTCPTWKEPAAIGDAGKGHLA
jgi:hypothetical protein